MPTLINTPRTTHKKHGEHYQSKGPVYSQEGKEI